MKVTLSRTNGQSLSDTSGSVALNASNDRPNGAGEPLFCRVYWAKQISAACLERHRRELKICGITAEAKRHLARGEWSRMFRKNNDAAKNKDAEMPFSKTEGTMRNRIWNTMGTLNEQDLDLLPNKLTTLNVLARLDAATIHRCIAEALIHPKLKKDEAEVLAARLKGLPIPERRPNVLRRVKNFREFIQRTWPVMADAERRAVGALRTVIGRLIQSAGQVQTEEEKKGD